MENKLNSYETMFVVSLANGDEATAATVNKFKTLIASNAEVVSVDDWGKRRMAYPIEDMNEGYYTVVTFKCVGDFPTELERLMNIDESVIRAMTVKLEYDASERAAVLAARKAAEEAAIEAEKEARRAERRAANPDGIANPNTSRRKVKKQLKAAENTEFAGLGKLTEEQKEDIRQKALEKELAKGGLSGDPNRPYSRGRAYDPNRYGKNQQATVEKAAEEPQEDSQQSTDSTDSQ